MALSLVNESLSNRIYPKNITNTSHVLSTVPYKTVSTSGFDDFIRFATQLSRQPSIVGVEDVNPLLSRPGPFARMEWDEKNTQFLKSRLEEISNGKFEDYILKTYVDNEDNLYLRDFIDKDFPNVVDKFMDVLFKFLDLHKKLARLFMTGPLNENDYKMLYYLTTGKINYSSRLLYGVVTRGDPSEIDNLNEAGFLTLFTTVYTSISGPNIGDWTDIAADNATVAALKSTWHSIPDSKLLAIIHGLRLGGGIPTANQARRTFLGSAFWDVPTYSVGGPGVEKRPEIIRWIQNLMKSRGLFNPRKYWDLKYSPFDTNVQLITIGNIPRIMPTLQNPFRYRAGGQPLIRVNPLPP